MTLFVPFIEYIKKVTGWFLLENILSALRNTIYRDSTPYTKKNYNRRKKNVNNDVIICCNIYLFAEHESIDEWLSTELDRL